MAEEPRRKRSIQSSGAGNELVIVMEPPAECFCLLKGGFVGRRPMEAGDWVAQTLPRGPPDKGLIR